MRVVRENLPLDHLGIAVRELSALRERFCALGFFATEPKGLQSRSKEGGASSQGQQSCHIVFPHDYIELTAVEAGVENHLARYLNMHQGLHILALNSDDIASDHTDSQSRGVEASPLQEASRMVTYGSGGEARFHWFEVGKTACPLGLVCVVEHLTPEIVFQREVMVHPNGATGISAILVGADTAEDVLDEYAPTSAQKRAVRVLRMGDDEHRLFPNLPRKTLAGFGVTVENLARTAEYLRGIGIEYREMDGKLTIPPVGAENCLLWFEAGESVK